MSYHASMTNDIIAIQTTRMTNAIITQWNQCLKYVMTVTVAYIFTTDVGAVMVVILCIYNNLCN